MRRRSEVALTGRKRERGTLTPQALLKKLIPAPTAVSSCTTFWPLAVLGLTMMSRLMPPDCMTRLIARKSIQILFVLKTLNLLTDLNSSRYSGGTWATSRSETLPSYDMMVPPLISARVLSVSSMQYSDLESAIIFRIFVSTVAPRLSTLERKMYSLPCAMRVSTRPLLKRASKKSPCPGGYQSSLSKPLWVLGMGSSESLRIRGYLLCWKVVMVTFASEYFWMIFAVSASVLNEFIRRSGTSAPSLSVLSLSICCTMRSRNVVSPLTSMTLFGPVQPMLVPSPPLSLTTASFPSSPFSSAPSGSGSSACGLSMLLSGLWISDQSSDCLLDFCSMYRE
mmetsp:Transcript_27443/g.68889  ORF Transcript_27443/g.68889 Transcript_27443/m.68889 type:complete len:338 (-) Transcript_27443:215-1228(-)